MGIGKGLRGSLLWEASPRGSCSSGPQASACSVSRRGPGCVQGPAQPSRSRPCVPWHGSPQARSQKRRFLACRGWERHTGQLFVPSRSRAQGRHARFQPLKLQKQAKKILINAQRGQQAPGRVGQALQRSTPAPHAADPEEAAAEPSAPPDLHLPGICSQHVPAEEASRTGRVAIKPFSPARPAGNGLVRARSSEHGRSAPSEPDIWKAFGRPSR